MKALGRRRSSYCGDNSASSPRDCRRSNVSRPPLANGRSKRAVARNVERQGIGTAQQRRENGLGGPRAMLRALLSHVDVPAHVTARANGRPLGARRRVPGSSTLALGNEASPRGSQRLTSLTCLAHSWPELLTRLSLTCQTLMVLNDGPSVDPKPYQPRATPHRTITDILPVSLLSAHSPTRRSVLLAKRRFPPCS